MDYVVARRARALFAGFLLASAALVSASDDAAAIPTACIEADIETANGRSTGIEEVCPFVDGVQQPGSDPVWNSMPTTARGAFSQTNATTTVIGPVRVPVPVALASGSHISCWWFHVWVEGKSSYGNTLWTYHQELDWCGDGTRIRHHVTRTRWGETSTPGWHFRGHTGKSGSGKVGSWAARRWTQGKFQLCWAWCVQEAHPWIDMTVRADGSYSYDTSAN